MKICKQCVIYKCGVDDIFRCGGETMITKCKGGCSRMTMCQEISDEELAEIKKDGDLLRELEKRKATEASER